MSRLHYNPQAHGDLVIKDTDDEALKNAFIYYLANQICTPKLTEVYDYKDTYEQLKQQMMPKKTNSNYQDARAKWPQQIFTWLREIYPEIIKSLYQQITQQTLSNERLQEIKQNLNNKDSDLYKKLNNMAQGLKNKDIALNSIPAPSSLRDLLISDFLIDFITHHSNDFQLDLTQAINLIIKLYNENQEKTFNEYLFFQQFVEQITVNLKDQRFISIQPSSHTLSRIKKYPLNFSSIFDFTDINKIPWKNGSLQSATLKTKIQQELKDNYDKNSKKYWTNNLSDDTIALIKLYGLYHAIVNKLMPKYQAFAQNHNVRQKQAKALELYRELTPLFSQFDNFVNNALIKFCELLIEKRKQLGKQLPPLIYEAHKLDNYITILRTGFQFEINDFKELMASLQLTIRSFRYLYKQYFREAYFYPYFRMQDIVGLQKPSKQLNIEENIFLPKTATFNYRLKGFGVVPVSYTLNLTGVIDPYVPDFGKYVNDIKPFEKLEARGFTHQEFFQWLKYTYQVKPEKIELNNYTDNISEQQLLMQRLAVFAICLFIVEGIRNPGSLVTNLINLNYLARNQPQEDIPTALSLKLNEYFPMTEIHAANIGRSLAHQSSPQPKSPLGTKESSDHITALMKKQNETLKRIDTKNSTFGELTLFFKKKITKLSKEEEQKKFKAIYQKGLEDLATTLTQEKESTDLSTSDTYQNLCQAIDKLQKKDESKEYYNLLRSAADELQHRVSHSSPANKL